MKRFILMIRQYYELFFVILCILYFFRLSIFMKELRFDNFLLSFFICLFVLISFKLSIKFSYLFFKPKKCKILHIVKKKGIYNIHMKLVYIKSNAERRKNFKTDFDKIFMYADENNIYKLATTTHYVVVLHLIKIYSNEKSKVLKEININESKEFPTSFGKMTVERIPDCINTCARYEYGKYLTFKQFKKSLELKKFYKITFLLTKST